MLIAVFLDTLSIKDYSKVSFLKTCKMYREGTVQMVIGDRVIFIRRVVHKSRYNL